MSEEGKICFDCDHKSICRYTLLVTKIHKELGLSWDAFMPERIYQELAIHCGHYKIAKSLAKGE